MKLFNIVVIGAFFEELFFRGFLLGQLFRYAKWGIHSCRFNCCCDFWMWTFIRRD
ncbi:CPBP family glutamic-type intramembrane protease [Bacteroides salyersiae]|nr:CPBP family glutamic-type intramembrane protease [Bacteroides salyersiae]